MWYRSPEYPFSKEGTQMAEAPSKNVQHYSSLGKGKSIQLWEFIIHQPEWPRQINDYSCWWGCGVSETFIHCWWECKFIKLWWKSMQFPGKLRIHLPQDPLIPLLGIYPMVASSYLRDTCLTISTSALFLKAINWNSLDAPQQKNGQRKHGTFTLWNTSQLVKKNKIMKFASKWMELEQVILSEET